MIHAQQFKNTSTTSRQFSLTIHWIVKGDKAVKYTTPQENTTQLANGNGGDYGKFLFRPSSTQVLERPLSDLSTVSLITSHILFILH